MLESDRKVDNALQNRSPLQISLPENNKAQIESIPSDNIQNAFDIILNNLNKIRKDLLLN